jgi:ectoine hydroxylase-related dioxygenase (phytanoyl-CoA dioxygenase family)
MTAIASQATEKDVEFYQKNGYVQYKTFFTRQELAPLRQAIDHAIATQRERIKGAEKGGRLSEDYERVFNQMVNLWTDYPAAREIAFHPRLAETARRLSRSKHVRIYHDHAMIKPAGQISKETNWHQDAPYWPMDPVGALSAWIAVDDVTLANGCLHFVPGTHHHGRLPPIKLGVEGESIVAKMKEQGYDVPLPVAMEMPAGGVTFHHGCTFHYAGPNRTDQPRRAFAIIYIPDYTRFTGGRDAAGAADQMQAGGPWDHPLHPILAGE